MDTKEINLEEFKNTLFDIQKLSYMIQDNKLPFTYNKECYRVRMPNQKERFYAEEYRSEKQIEFIQRKNCKTKDELKQILKKNKVIDLDKLEKEVKKLQKQIKEVYFKLAPRFNEEKEKIEEETTKIIELQNQLMEINQEITKHLSPSLEDRLESVYLEYLTYQCTEKLIGKEFVKVWNTFEEWENDNSPLSTRARICMAHLLFNVNQF